MKNCKNLQIKLCFFAMISICIMVCCSMVNAEDELDKLFGASGNDPFSQLASQKPTEMSGKAPGSDQEKIAMIKPPLNVANITLEFLEAKNLEPIVQSMLSGFGSVSTDEKSNSLIVCDDVNNLSRIVEQIDKTDKAGHQAIFVETLTLKFLDAENLQKAMTSMSSKYGSIAVDLKTNSLIVCDAKENLSRIAEQIRKADRMPEQILIEVVIVDVQLDDSTEIGVDWNNIFKTGDNIGYKQDLVSTIADGATSGGDFKLIMNSITGTVHALQETKDIEILASPKVLVLSGQEAMIQTIQEIPYREITDTSQGGAGALSSTQFKEVGVTLKVKATVTETGKIMMKIEPEQSVNTGILGGDADNVPVIDKRSAMTTLMMNDGQVVVMGGLRKSETKITKTQVPLLGDLPYIGILFANDKKEIKNSELLVMLSPHIYKNDVLTPGEAERFNDLRDRPYLELKEEKRPELEALSAITPSYKKNPPQWDWVK